MMPTWWRQIETVLRWLLLISGHFCIYELSSLRFTPYEYAFGALFVVSNAFGVSVIYHRYYSHRSFALNRFWQFVFTFFGLASFQLGPLWWASYHRIHHEHADHDGDPHSAKQGFFHAYLGWFMKPSKLATRGDRVQDFKSFKEIVFLDQYAFFISIFLMMGFATASFFVFRYWPQNFSHPYALFYLYISAVLYGVHLSGLCNTFCHLGGYRRYQTQDSSYNNGWLGLIHVTGEAWHNNHHRYPRSAKIGLAWWEIDYGYYMIKILSWLGIASKINLPPKDALSS